jgi:parallel beta-helix repeat protein
VNPGTYSGPVNIPASGTASGGYVSFYSLTSGAAKITGGTNGFVITGQSYISISGFTINGTTKAGIAATTASNITLTFNTVTASGQPKAGQNAPGISLTGVTNSTIRNNTADGNSLHGIVLGSGSTNNFLIGNEASQNAEGWSRGADGINVSGSGNRVLDNIVHDNEQSGIHLAQGADSATVADNVAYNNGDHGIQAQNVTGGNVVNNTVYRNCTSGINVEGTSSAFSVKNNVAVDNAVLPAYKGITCTRRVGNIGVYDNATTGTSVDSNLVNLTASGAEYAWGSGTYSTLSDFQAASGQSAHDVVGDPKFANPANWDLHLTEGSPAIDSADSAAPGIQENDADGTSHVDDPTVANTGLGSTPYDDRGAYEFQPTAIPPTAKIAFDATSGTAPFAFNIGAWGSTPGSTPIASYTFDFGDGTVVGPQSRPNQPHVYTSAGTFTVKVTVTDSAGRSASATTTVTVTIAPPTANLAVSPPSGTAPLQVTADASKSTPGSAPIASYTFDFGDGSAKVGPQAGPTATHTYASGGTYTATVTVTDSTGATGTATYKVTVADPAPAGHWTLSDGSGATAADTGNPGSHAGTVSVPGVSWGSGYAMFAGTGGTITSSGPVIDTTKSFTVAAWVNPQTLGASTQTLLVQQATVNSGFYLEYNGSTWQFAEPTADTSTSSTQRITSTAPASANVWTHLVGTYDASTHTMTLYVNGVSNGSGTNPTPIASSGPLVMGRGFLNGSSGNPFTGALADVRLYQQALTGAEAQSLYQNSGFGAQALPGTAGALVSDVPTSGDPTRQLCVDDIYGNTTNSSSVVGIWDCNHHETQAWSFQSDGTIRIMGLNPTPLSTKCLDTGGLLTQGAKITLYDCIIGNKFQQWRISPSTSTPGHASIVNPASGLCLDDTGGSTTDGTQFQLNQCLDNASQRFLLPTGIGRVQSAEAESVVASNNGGTWYVQTNCCGASWSNGAQQFLNSASTGNSLTLSYYVANAGLYQVTPVMTKAADYGEVSLTIDNTTSALSNVFDGWQASGVSTTPFSFGTAQLSAGIHTFTFKPVGTNTASTGDRYNLGSDVLSLVPTVTAGPVPAQTLSATGGYAPLPVTADATATIPGGAVITSYTFDFGDGSPKVGPQSAATATHTYAAIGSYTVTVTVADANQLRSTATAQVAVKARPILPNGDFETGTLAGWGASHDATVTTTNPHSGTYAGEIDAAAADGNGSIEQVVTGLTPNTPYTLTGWVRTDGSTTYLGAKQYDSTGNTADASTTNTGWTKLTDYFTTGASGTSVDVYCYRPTVGTSACDDITLQATPATVANSDFETGTLAGWSASHDATVTTTNPHSGTYAGEIDAAAADGNGSIEQVVTGLTPNTPYTLTGWVRTDGSTTYLGAKQYDTAGNTSDASTTNTGWTELTDYFTTGASGTSVDIYCYRPTVGTSACDDITLQATPATVANSDFETGNLAGWSASHDAGVTTTNPHSGTYAGEIDAAAADGNGSIEQVVTGLTPNTPYTLTGWVRTDGSTTYLGAKQYDTAGNTSDASTISTGWTELTDYFTTGASGTSVDIYCYRPTVGTSACDDITLTKN